MPRAPELVFFGYYGYCSFYEVCLRIVVVKWEGKKEWDVDERGRIECVGMGEGVRAITAALDS